MDDERDLDWAGIYNVRGLGGLPTKYDGTTRFGPFVRCEGLDRLESRQPATAITRDARRRASRIPAVLRSGFWASMGDS